MIFQTKTTILITQAAVLIIGLVLAFLPLSCVEQQTANIIAFIGWLTATFAILSFLLTIQLEEHNESIRDKLFQEREKVSDIYRKNNTFFNEKELEEREIKLGLNRRDVKNHVIIISNDLSKECGEWTGAVIRNIKNSVTYTYFTTQTEVKYIEGIKKSLEKRKITDIEKKIHVHCIDLFFDLMPIYSEIVIYDNIGNNHSNIQECYTCFSNNPDELLLYEKANHAYCKRVVIKINNIMNYLPSDIWYNMIGEISINQTSVDSTS